MSFKFLKSNQIKLYKRENSKYWQMKIKLPRQQAVRSSTGSKNLKNAELIAIKNYKSLNNKNSITIRRNHNNIYKKIHLVETADLNKKRNRIYIR